MPQISVTKTYDIPDGELPNMPNLRLSKGYKVADLLVDAQYIGDHYKLEEIRIERLRDFEISGCEICGSTTDRHYDEDCFK